MGCAELRSPASVILWLALIGCDSPFFEIYDGGQGPIDTDSGAGAVCSEIAVGRRAVPGLPPQSDIWLAVPVGSDSVLIAAGEPARYFWVSADGAPEEVIGVGATGFAPRAAWVDGDVLWLAGMSGMVARADLDRTRRPGTIRVVGTSTFGETIIALDGVPATDELWMLSEGTHAGRVARYDGTSFASMWVGPELGPDARGGMGLARSPAGEVFALPLGATCRGRARCILRFAGDGAHEEAIESTEPPSTLASLPGWGLIAGTEHGQVLLREGASWRPVAGSPLLSSEETRAIWTKQLVPFGDSVVLLSDLYWMELKRDLQYCPWQRTSFFSNFDFTRGGVRLGPNVLLFGRPAGVTEIAVAFVQ